MAKTDNPIQEDVHLPEQVSIRRWFLFYAVYFLALAIPLAYLVQEQPSLYQEMLRAVGRFFKSFGQIGHFGVFCSQIKAAGWDFQVAFSHITPQAKLLFMGIYLSLCMTFFPMPTSVMVSLLATQTAGIGAGWGMVLLVGAVSGSASTVANLNDYHFFLWLLRHHRVARIRQTRTYRLAAKWFAKGPFVIMVVFNIIIIPVDIPRMLAAVYGYPRHLFAASNFLGRFVRYAVVALITYKLKDKDWLAPLAFLAMGLLIALVKIVPAIFRKRRRADPSAMSGSGS